MNKAAWYPGIERACRHWREAVMLQQTFEAMVKSFEEENDAAIDCAKCVVEVVCQIIVGEFDSVATPYKPQTENPSIGEWLSCAVRALRLGEGRDNEFRKLVSSHHKLAGALNDLRNKAGPVSHGKEGYLNRLTTHHRRSAVLAADAIVSFLFQAFIEENVNLALTREPFERFDDWNALIDEHVGIEAEIDEEEGTLNLTVVLPDKERFPLSFPVSRVLFQLDREAYKEALAAAQRADVALQMEGGAQ